MFRSRKSIVMLLLALMLAVAVPAASAAGGTTTHDVATSTASFTIPAGQCPHLAAGLSVSGSGDRVTATDTTVNADGSSRTTINDAIHGAATDSNGKKYSFFYGNYFTIDAPASGAAKAKMYDVFLLQSVESAAGNRYVLRNGFVWRWTFTPPADPFAVWPPVDFAPLITYGDPISAATATAICDPL